jgi:DNA-binding GntR family transcriptional regulator
MPDTQNVLCARFSVSRTPLREVLKMLSVKGLVNLLPNRGASVVCITQQEAEKLIPLLETIESHASEHLR